MTPTAKQKINQLQLALDSGDRVQIIDLLDQYKGSYAVKYVLHALLSKTNQHTIRGVLDLIEKKP